MGLIEGHCDWAVPDFSELELDLLNQVQGDYYKGPGASGGTPNTFKSNFSISSSSVLGTPTGDVASAAALGNVKGQRHMESLVTGLLGTLVGGVIVWIYGFVQAKHTVLREP